MTGTQSAQHPQSTQRTQNTQQKPKIVVLLSDQLFEEIMTPQAQEQLAALGEVVRYRGAPDRRTRVDAEAVADLLKDAEAVITGWGATPKFDNWLLERTPMLRFIGHTAGTIKGFVGEEALAQDIVVTHAAGTIAIAVGEWALTVILASLRRVCDFNADMHARNWNKAGTGHGQTLHGKRVGIIAASMTARALIPLLKPWGCDILVFDPYLSADRATELGVRRAPDLDELFQTCDIVTNHAPTTPETDGIIDARRLALLRDGALFVNTARARAIEYDALTRELQSGRIYGALDVFPKEPLEPESPLWTLPNVILSPHVAGATVESRLQLGQTIVDELTRFYRGEPLKHQVRKEQLATMA